MSSSQSEYNPLVSIALATFNGSKFIHKQLDSLLVQTYTNFEIVISDDHSTDETSSIIESYAKLDSRIRIFQNHLKKGVVGNFTAAIEHCKGEVIFFCDQDDVWYKDKIAQHVDMYQDPKVQWVYNEVRLTNQTGQPIGLLTDKLPDYWTRRKLLYYTWGSCVLGCATSYRTSLIKKLWPADPFATGHDSWIQLAIYPAKSYYIPEILQDYRQHDNNAAGLPSFKADFKADEKLAIHNNLLYLQSLSSNHTLQIWKRLFFKVVFYAKQLRRILFMSKTS